MEKTINIDAIQLFQAVYVIDKFIDKLNNKEHIIDTVMKKQIHEDIIKKYNFFMLDKETIYESKIVR